MTKDPRPGDAPDPHEQAIVDAFMEAVNADSPRDAGDALKRHPELLNADTLAFLDDVMAHQNDEIQEATGPLLDLLERAIAIGVDPAVREVEEAIADEEARPPSVGLETPAGFEADVDALVKLTDRAKTDPKLHRERVAFIQKLLAKVGPNGPSNFRGALMGSLGNSFAGLPDADRGANLRGAIEAWTAALTTYTRAADPVEFARLRLRLAHAHMELGDDLDEAAEGLEDALSVHTLEADPVGYALIHHDLADVRRTQGRLRDMVQSDLEALRVVSREEDPDAYVELQLDLASAYQKLAGENDDRSLNLAIDRFREALPLLDPQADPTFVAGVQSNLASALLALTGGDRAAQVTAAIASYRESLKLLTPDADPLMYASVQHNLGYAYEQSQTGDRDATLSQAIACYQEALRFRTCETTPVQYAESQTNLARALVDRSGGDRIQNLEQAAEAIKAAICGYSKDRSPVEFAGSQHNLGAVYSTLMAELAKDTRGDRASRLAKAIEVGKQAVALVDPKKDPTAYARLQSNLAGAYAHLTTGDPAANHRAALAAVAEALRFVTPEGAPDEYADIRANEAVAYVDYHGGDRVQNVEHAIDALTDALRYVSAESDRSTFVTLQNNLAIAYRNRPTGDRTSNQEAAIAAYERALTALGDDTSSLEWARVMHNLGALYSVRVAGDRVANVERAIEDLEGALRVRTPELAPDDHASSAYTLGGIYALLDTGDLASNRERAIEYFEEALRYRTAESNPASFADTTYALGGVLLARDAGDGADIHRAIQCFEDAARYQSAETDPIAYARTQQLLGQAYARLAERELGKRVASAVPFFERAMAALDPATAPADLLRVAGALGDLHFSKSAWAPAIDAYTVALGAAQQLTEAAAATSARQAELEGVAGIFGRVAYGLAKLGRVEEAVVHLETWRARALSEALTLDAAALTQASDADREAFAQARDRVAALDAEARAPAGGSTGGAVRPFVEVAAELSAARVDLRTVIARIAAYVPDFVPATVDFPEIARAAESAPIAYLAVTEHGCVALMLGPGLKVTVEPLWLDTFTADDLDAILYGKPSDRPTGGLLGAQVEGDGQTLSDLLGSALTILHDRLLAPIASLLADRGLRSIVLLPGGRLGLLPLPAAAPDGLDVSLAPSARGVAAARRLAGRAEGHAQRLLGVGNPLPIPEGFGPLLFADAEVDAIAALFGTESTRTLIGEAATWPSVRAEMNASTHLHFACHGTFELVDPLDSGLFLAGGDRLTLRDLLDLESDLPVARLVVLSACQTGIAEFERVPDEAVGMPAGFLQAGVPGIISTLWSVSDIATAVLMAAVYRGLLVDHLTPSAALRRAQTFVRSSTAAELDLLGWYERAHRGTGREDGSVEETAAYLRAHAGDRPFADPFFWAAFVFTGA